MEAIRLVIDELSKTGRMYILTGDFNLKHDWCYSMLEHIMKSYNAKQIVTEPTRGNALLDLIITNRPTMCINTNVSNPHISDHCAISTYITVRREKKKTTFSFRDFKSIKEHNLYKDLNEYLAPCTQSTDVHSSFENLLHIITTITEKHAPMKSKTINQHTKATKLSDYTKNEMYKRDQLYKLSLLETSTTNKFMYKRQKQLVKKLIIEDSKSFVQSSMDEKGIWPILTALTKAKTKISIPFSPDEINTHFTDISNRPTTCSPTVLNNDTEFPDKFKISEVSSAELSFVWRRMKNKQSTGTDSLGMSNYMFNLLMQSNKFREVLLNFLNMSITQCIVPYKLKIAKIVAIPKCDKPVTLNDVRPISILPVISKVLEKCVYLQLRRYVSAMDKSTWISHCHGFDERNKVWRIQIHTTVTPNIC